VQHLDARLEVRRLVREELDYRLVSSDVAEVVEALVELRHFPRNLVDPKRATLLDVQLQKLHDRLHKFSKQWVEDAGLL
jgi:hypothetical protein